jgi:putative oxidoreductase
MRMDRAKLQSLSYAVLRIVAGALFSMHGAQKLFGFLATHPGPEMWSQTWFGGVIELACGILIALGLFTRPAAFLASGTMAVAYFQFHWKGAMGSGLFPIVNGGELAVIYCFVFLAICAHGAGMVSLDRVRGKV